MMNKKLGGTTFVLNGLKYDYCFVESINSLKEFCSEVVICDAGSTDGTVEVLKQLEDAKTKVIYRDKDEWEGLRSMGKERLNYFSNIAIEHLTTEWNFYQQADEILHQNSYASLCNAINSGFAEGYFITRVNLWGSPYTKLNVPQNRLPCSEYVLRLAKSKYLTYGDAESIACDDVNADFIHKIRMYHFGFVRSAKVMKAKVINMQEEVFLTPHDSKLDGSDIFIPERWFSGDDLAPITEELPKIMSEWVKTRP